MEKDFKQDPDVLAMSIDLGPRQGAVLCYARHCHVLCHLMERW